MGMFFPHKGAVCYKQSFILHWFCSTQQERRTGENGTAPIGFLDNGSFPFSWRDSCHECMHFTKGLRDVTTAQHSYFLAEGILLCVCDLCPGKSLHGFFQLASSIGLTLEEVLLVTLSLARLETPCRQFGFYMIILSMQALSQ